MTLHLCKADPTEDTVSTLQVSIAVVTPDVLLHKDAPPVLDPLCLSEPESPPDLTEIADGNVPVVLALLDNVLKASRRLRRQSIS